MTCLSHVFRHSKKLRNAPGLLRHDHSILARWFANDACASTDRGDDILKFCQLGNVPGVKDRVCKSSSECASSTANFNHSYRAINPAMILLVGIHRGIVLRTATKVETPTGGLVFNRGFSCSQVHARRNLSTDSGLPLHEEIGMPSLSPTMTEGNIVRWLKKEGDKVSPGEVLCEVETDKATVEMECMEDGYLAKIIRGDGAKEIKVGEVIAITVEDEEDVAKFKDYKPSTSDAAPAPAPAPKGPTVSTPLKEEVVKEPVSSPEPKVSKPSTAPASPPDGRIVKADGKDYLASRGKEVSAPSPKVGSTAAALDYTDIPHSETRKVVASLFLLSKQTIPHYYLTVDTCVDKLMDLQSQLNSLQEASGAKWISVNDLVIKAAALALRKFPQCNSSWTNDYIRQYHNVNINVAVQTDNGAFIPVIRDADKKGFSKIAEEVDCLAQKAQENSLKPEDSEGGTFTLVNLGGPYGIKQFCAVIIPPQSSILAVGSAEKRVIPGLGPDEFKFASFMSVTLSCDHRVVDGAISAEWLKAFKGYIENPESMML